MADVQLATIPTNAIGDDGKPVTRDTGLSAIFDRMLEEQVDAPAKKEDAPIADTEPEAKTETPTETAPLADSEPVKDEVKVETHTEPEPAAKEPETNPDADALTDDDLRRMPRSQAKKIAKTRERMKELESTLAAKDSTIAEREKALAEYEAKVKQLEEQTKQFDPEQFKKAQEELLQYKRLHALESDPRLKENFDTPLSQVDDTIIGLLKRHGLSDKNAELIKSQGGFRKFAEKNPETANLIFQKMEETSRTDLADLHALRAEEIRIMRERERFIQTEKAAATQWFEQQAQLAAQEQQAYVRHSEAIKAEHEQWLASQANLDIFKQEQVPTTASAEEKKRIQELNGVRAQLRAVAKEALFADTPEARRQVALLAAAAQWHKRQADTTAAELAAVKAELAKVKGSTRTVPKASSGTSTTTKATSSKPASLTEALNLIAQGKNPNETEE